MPTLRNPKHEKFCQAMLQHDGNGKKVMAEAGYKWNNSYFSQLKNNPKISARLIELRKSVVSDKILNLQQRLEMLSDIARDTSVLKPTRIKALHEIYVQCGDAVNKLDIDLNATTNNVVRFVEIMLPKTKESKEKMEITGKELESLDQFLAND